jgi:hypothetical protein
MNAMALLLAKKPFAAKQGQLSHVDGQSFIVIHYTFVYITA